MRISKIRHRDAGKTTLLSSSATCLKERQRLHGTNSVGQTPSRLWASNNPSVRCKVNELLKEHIAQMHAFSQVCGSLPFRVTMDCLLRHLYLAYITENADIKAIRDAKSEGLSEIITGDRRANMVIAQVHDSKMLVEGCPIRRNRRVNIKI